MIRVLRGLVLRRFGEVGSSCETPDCRWFCGFGMIAGPSSASPIGTERTTSSATIMTAMIFFIAVLLSRRHILYHRRQKVVKLGYENDRWPGESRG